MRRIYGAHYFPCLDGIWNTWMGQKRSKTGEGAQNLAHNPIGLEKFSGLNFKFFSWIISSPVYFQKHSEMMFYKVAYSFVSHYITFSHWFNRRQLGHVFIASCTLFNTFYATLLCSTIFVGILRKYDRFYKHKLLRTRAKHHTNPWLALQ